LVVGEVNIQGNLEYDATLENIREEYRARPTDGSQRLHMWLTLGDDVIVDPGLADRLIKYYRCPSVFSIQLSLPEPMSSGLDLRFTTGQCRSVPTSRRIQTL
jgi:hypothetical protein